MGNNYLQQTESEDPSKSNAILDDAFTRMQLYLYATSNPLVRDLLYKNIKELSNEVAKRDSSMSFKLSQHLQSLKQWIKKEKKNGRK